MRAIAMFWNKRFFALVAVGVFLLLSARVYALPMGEREIAHFERETLKCAREVFKKSGNFSGGDFTIELSNEIIHETLIKRATIVFNGFEPRDYAKFSTDGFDFAALKKIDRIEVEAVVEASEIKSLVTRELNRVSAGKRIFADVAFEFGQNRVTVSGKIDLQKVPGNPFGFLPQSLSPFNAEITVKLEGSLIVLEILSGEMNNQPLTPELSKMLLDWLNPLWNFDALPYDASLETLQISPAGVKFSGSLF